MFKKFVFLVLFFWSFSAFAWQGCPNGGIFISGWGFGCYSLAECSQSGNYHIVTNAHYAFQDGVDVCIYGDSTCPEGQVLDANHVCSVQINLAGCNQSATQINTDVSLSSINGGSTPTATRGQKTGGVDLKKLAAGVVGGGVVGGLPGAAIGAAVTLGSAAIEALLSEPPVINQTCNITQQNGAAVSAATMQQALQQFTAPELKQVLDNLTDSQFDCLIGLPCTEALLCGDGETMQNGYCSVQCPLGKKSVMGSCVDDPDYNSSSGSGSGLVCTAPQVKNAAGTGCVNPSGSTDSLTCIAPQIKNTAGDACVNPVQCTAPQVKNAAGDACITPSSSPLPVCTDAVCCAADFSVSAGGFLQNLKTSFPYRIPQYSLVSSVCPSLSVSLFGQSVSTSAHCDVFESLKPNIELLSIFFYTLAAFLIVLSA